MTTICNDNSVTLGGMYYAFHSRLRRERGDAREFPCAEEGCDRPAREWAWDHTGEVVVEDLAHFGKVRPVAFSLDASRYIPLCRSCHIIMDLRTDPETFPCGHPRSEENTRERPNGQSAYCVICNYERVKRWRAAKRGH